MVRVFGGNVVAMRHHYAISVFVLTLGFLAAAKAEIIFEKNVGNKTVTCMRTGLTSNLKDCGDRSDWYSYVFVGSISNITPAGNDEMKIQIVPEEVFWGKPDTPVTVQTSQGICFPTLAVGGRWLFYLRKKTGEPIVLDFYGNESLPIADAQESIATLRRLKGIGSSGILRGQVVRGSFIDGKAVPKARVIAERRTGHKRFVAVTDANGRYEFQPLPKGSYRVKVELTGPHIEDDNSDIDIKQATCWDLTLSISAQARVDGDTKNIKGSTAGR